MFERFLEVFGGSADRSRRPTPARPAWGEVASEGWDALMSEYSGASFQGGLYRLHDADSGARADRLIADRFPDDAGTFYAFGWDWLGRHFVLDRRRRSATGEPLVMMVDLVTAERFLIDYTFEGFHDVVLDVKRDSAVDADVFQGFAAANPSAIPLAWDRIVGYKIPLQLGGRHVVDNMEVVDMDVELELGSQIAQQTEGATEGTTVRSVELRKP